MTAAIYNPENRPVDRLPVIYGYCKGGGFLLRGGIVSEDGEVFGYYTSRTEDGMQCDLGVADGYRPDRHVLFQEHYPNGYRMQFVSFREFKFNAVPGLVRALELSREKQRETG